MKNKILSYLLAWLLVLPIWLTYVYAQQTTQPWWWQQWWQQQWWKKCNWVKLNTNFPIIWDCIWDDNGEDSTNAFPTMIWALTKIIISLILVVCFILIIVAWIMRAWDKPKEWKELLTKVAITILLLWFSSVILKLINPNFFG